MRTGREKIEAKLRMTEEEKTIVNIQRTIEDIQEFDAMLCRLEALAGLPLFFTDRSRFQNGWKLSVFQVRRSRKSTCVSMH